VSAPPIAVVGRGCVLPGALDPDALWRLVREGRSALAPAGDGRWSLSPGADQEALAREAACDVGGYVSGFEPAFDPEGFRIAVDATLDPVFLWPLHAARQALREAGRDIAGPPVRGAVILGNLSYPTPGLVRFALDVWGKATPSVDPRNRFMSGLPAALVARALGFEGPAFALDAACASSLYAIKLACDRLAEGSVDFAVAGGVNHADDLFLHLGFTSLAALSPSGRSRPFHRDADGLVPAQGAAVVLLRRLSDALADGQPVLGVIRGVGLGNDGRSRGLLVPSEEGQARAMRAAYRAAGVEPSAVSLMECHATGTTVGDAVEVRSLRAVFEGSSDLPLGSLKSNLGHLITASGAAALLKVLGAMRAGERPPTLHAEPPLPELAAGPLRLLHTAEPWPDTRPRIAGISNFGFGGNNAHLVVEEWRAPARRVPRGAGPAGGSREAMAVVALAARAGSASSTAQFTRALREGRSLVQGGEARAQPFEMDLAGLRFPPADLLDALPQQTWLLDTVLTLAPAVTLPGDRTSLFVGMQCDAEVARCGLRWRREGARSGRTTDGPLKASVIVGCMPNVLANRLNQQLGLTAPCFTVSAEEASGVVALELAAAALRAGEIDAAVVAAVDLCCEPVQGEAARRLWGRADAPGDAVAVLVVKRLADAQRDSDRILATLAPGGEEAGGAELQVGGGGGSLAWLLGHAHAASGLLHVAAAVMACHEGIRPPDPGGPAGSWNEAPEERRLQVRVRDAGGGETVVSVRGAAAAPLPEAFPPPASGERRHRLPLPAHLEPVRLEDAGGDAYEIMAPPPRLPPARRWPPSSPEAIAAIAPLPPAAPSLAEHHRQLSELHTAFLRRQAELHAHFLRALFATVPAPAPPARPGPRLGRAELEALASGPVSAVLGPLFRAQDAFARVVRLPEPPLLLVDRVTGIAGEPGSMGLGTLWTETDIPPDAWYLHEGRMPGGILIESGQADLLLISWLGIDAHNRGERVYRLLGCDLTCHGGLPGPGETLSYEIHVDGHAQQGDVRLFFFHYDCYVDGTLRVSVRGGQAGFFTDAELAASTGVLFRPEDVPPTPDGRVDPPAAASAKRSFSAAEVGAFVEGRPRECFGPGFERADTHTRTPTIQGGRLRLVEEVTHFDPAGGPWKRGYMRARLPLSPDHWFFAGHFKNDPCMPGTLMFEGGLQTMALYLAATGFTLARDGFRFEPVPEHAYRLRCRGQATPASRELVYELFVDELIDGPTPTLYADLLGTVDGLKAFHCRRMGLRLVHAYPMDAGRLAVTVPAKTRESARAGDFVFGARSLLACAWGRPSEAFGPLYAPFDAGPRVPRLPGPPYHFMSNVASVSGALGGMEVGSTAVAEYDVPPDAWYFAESSSRRMPFAVLLEVALQPCGWLASYAGCAATAGQEVAFRNLDGSGAVEREVGPDAGTLTTSVRLQSLSRAGGVLIAGFSVRVASAAGTVLALETVFGFFPPGALREQTGLPEPPPREEPSPPSAEASPASTASGRLRMLDRVLGLWPEGGRAGLGRITAERDVRAADWYFRAHFMGDPVQPGSLGLEAMVQALQTLALAKGLGGGPGAGFEALAAGVPITWKYRGQVLPENEAITVDVEVTEVRPTPSGPIVVAEGSLRVDGKRIYQASGLSVRVLGAHRHRGAWGQSEMWRLSRPMPSLLPPAELHRQVPVLWIQTRMPMRGPLEVGALADAIRATFGRYDVLHSVIAAAHTGPSGPPTLEVLPGWLPEVETADLAELPAAAQEARQERFFEEPIDPAAGPPARVAIFRTGADRHVLCMAQHHLFTDGVSMVRFWKEVVDRYGVASRGVAPALRAPGPSFEEYCRAQQAWLDSEASAAARAYWTRALAGAQPLRLPVDAPRTEPSDFAGERAGLDVDADLFRRLGALCAAESVGMFAVLLTALGTTLHRATGQEDLLFVTFHANRVLPGFPGAATVMGPLVQGVPLRIRVERRQTPRERLRQVHQSATEALEHGGVPMDFMRDVLGLDLPAPQVSLMYQAFIPPATIEIGPLTIQTSEPLGFGRGRTGLELELVLWPADGGLKGVAAWATQIFRRGTAERLVAEFRRQLEALA
jgi:3-oxoacyl-(acyl-carrier-protein) synthase/3-hydroxymyristoyl/3-hydroxydecanoyl-(acyl carrier protein) dehydratase